MLFCYMVSLRFVSLVLHSSTSPASAVHPMFHKNSTAALSDQQLFLTNLLVTDLEYDYLIFTDWVKVV
ncbi:hypothetical protein GLYMA_13G067650v4 [Glycine max]|nr:hypothetical protein GLYMA_13G067650v4 [Glycine max]KAH1100174.1 hypothetical protein GYH30_035367 [Glycine max]